MPMNRSPVRGWRPWTCVLTRSAWWPAMTRSGIAGARALKTVSTIVIGNVIHQRIGAGRVALTTVPGGTIEVRPRNAPSLIG